MNKIYTHIIDSIILQANDTYTQRVTLAIYLINVIIINENNY